LAKPSALHCLLLVRLAQKPIPDNLLLDTSPLILLSSGIMADIHTCAATNDKAANKLDWYDTSHTDLIKLEGNPETFTEWSPLAFMSGSHAHPLIAEQIPTGSITQSAWPCYRQIASELLLNSSPRPQPALNNRKIFWPRGKLFGGTPPSANPSPRVLTI
jgi:hypothetical protein